MSNNKSDKESSWVVVVEYPSHLNHEKMDTKIDKRSGTSKVFREGKPVSSMPTQCWGETIGNIRRLRQSYDEQWKAMEAAKRMEGIKGLTLIDVYDDYESIKKKEAMKKKLLLKGNLYYDDGKQGPVYELYINDAHTKDHKYSVEVLLNVDDVLGKEHIPSRSISPIFTNFGKCCKWLLDYWNERKAINEFGGG